MRCSLQLSLFTALIIQLGLGPSTAFQQVPLLQQTRVLRRRQAKVVLRRASWNDRYDEVAGFYRKHGYLKVEPKTNLYYWMVLQRQKRAGTGGRSPLSEERIRALDEINFPWFPEGLTVKHEDSWQIRYQELAEFYKMHGHHRVKTRSPLYNWMLAQRQKRPGKEGCDAPLTEEQIRLLDDINFPWEPERARMLLEAWRSRYQELKEHYSTHGHSKVSKASSTTLYYWMVTQRRKRDGKNGRSPLTEEQIRLLDEIEFPWANHHRS